MTAIFISHSSIDSAAAAEVKTWLEALSDENTRAVCGERPAAQ